MTETCPKQCPECGAMPWHPSKNSPNTWGWICGTTEHPGDNRVVSHWCLRRQVAALHAQLADSQRMREELTARAEAAEKRAEGLEAGIKALINPATNPGGINITDGIPSEIYVAIGRDRYDDEYDVARATAESIEEDYRRALAALLAPAAEEVEGGN